MLTPSIPQSVLVTVCAGFAVSMVIAKKWDGGIDELQPKARAEHTKKQQAMQKARSQFDPAVVKKLRVLSRWVQRHSHAGAGHHQQRREGNVRTDN